LSSTPFIHVHMGGQLAHTGGELAKERRDKTSADGLGATSGTSLCSGSRPPLTRRLSPDNFEVVDPYSCPRKISISTCQRMTTRTPLGQLTPVTQKKGPKPKPWPPWVGADCLRFLFTCRRIGKQFFCGVAGSSVPMPSDEPQGLPALASPS
jgi:hypothetical protein